MVNFAHFKEVQRGSLKLSYDQLCRGELPGQASPPQTGRARYPRTMPDQEMLDGLAALLKAEGYLSLKLMMTTKGIPHYRTYALRFGSLADVFRRVGFEPKARYCFKETAARTDHLISSVARDVIAELERRHRSVTLLQELRLLTISSTVTMSITLA